VRTGQGRELHPKRQQRIEAEERVILSLPGGGGFGFATERDPNRVAQDVSDGLVSAGRAREIYGVVLTKTDRYRYEVDIATTDRLRAEASQGVDTGL
jgi:N-methylhydantoinase B